VGTKKEKGRVSALLSYNCVRYPFRAEKTIILEDEESSFRISEDIFNVGEQEVEFSWAQHMAYGEPFVDENLQIEIPASKAKTHYFEMPHERVVRNSIFEWPLAPGLNGKKVDLSKIPSRDERVQEDFPIIELKDPSYNLYNPKLDLGVQVSWNREAFPVLWYWMNWGTLDYPWFGRGRTLALEPTTTPNGYGLGNQVKDGSASMLKQNSKIHGELQVNLFQNSLKK
jgi:hypothetical protein